MHCQFANMGFDNAGKRNVCAGCKNDFAFSDIFHSSPHIQYKRILKSLHGVNQADGKAVIFSHKVFVIRDVIASVGVYNAD